MHNRAFGKALHLLSRPISLGAVALLLVNDHLLRQLWPSWLTGKLGDLAWLFFFPFVAAAFLSWLIPSRVPRQEKLVGGLAFGLTGGVFLLANTHPGFHAWFARQAETILGFSVALTRDPTDLVALFALTASWRLWTRHEAPVPTFTVPGWVVLPMAALLTLANSAAANYGIECLTVQGTTVVATTFFEAFTSDDGGLSWQPSESDLRSGCPNQEGIDKTLPDKADLAPASQAQRAYYEKTRGGNVHFRPGPLDVKVDSSTGNTIYAMGHEGVLVYTSRDEWVWVAVGDYRRVSLSQPGDFFSLLAGEAILAIGLGLLCVNTLSLRLSRSWFRLIPLVILWGVWGFSVVILPPALTTGYLEAFLGLLLIPSALFVLALTFYSALGVMRRHVKVLVRAVIIALFGAGLFFLPYLLWALDRLPNYTAAVLFALALGAGTLLLGDRWVRPLLRKDL